MDLIEFAVNLLRDSILYILAGVTFITLVLTLRTLTLKGKKIDEIPPPPDEGKVEQEITPLPDESDLKQEILPLPDEIKVELEISPVPDEDELKQEIRPILEERTSETCEYCAIFKDLGTMVCPNCGRPLNLRLPEQRQP